MGTACCEMIGGGADVANLEEEEEEVFLLSFLDDFLRRF